MDREITLRLKESILAEAEQYAKRNGTSIPELIEAYLSTLGKETSGEKKETVFTPLVDRLSGIVKLSEEQEKLHRAAYRNFISDKYK